jgi:hypothetical protein
VCCWSKSKCNLKGIVSSTEFSRGRRLEEARLLIRGKNRFLPTQLKL